MSMRSKLGIFVGMQHMLDDNCSHRNHKVQRHIKNRYIGNYMYMFCCNYVGIRIDGGRGWRESLPYIHPLKPFVQNNLEINSDMQRE
jgi:hypothetical protein